MRKITDADHLRRDQRGITGLETAIVLIAFVVVASVFAFAVLSTGLLSSEKAKEQIVAGLEEVGATLQIKGSIVGNTTTTLTGVVHTVEFPVVLAGTQSVDLSAETVVTYIDTGQIVDLPHSDNPRLNTTSTRWGTDFGADTGPVLNSGERATVIVNVSGLNLSGSEQFTIQVKPLVGAILQFQKTTPSELTTVMILD